VTDRTIIVDESGSSSIRSFGFIAVAAVAALIALFVWPPWNFTTSTNGTTATVHGTTSADTKPSIPSTTHTF